MNFRMVAAAPLLFPAPAAASWERDWSALQHSGEPMLGAVGPGAWAWDVHVSDKPVPSSAPGQDCQATDKVWVAS